MTRPGFTLSLCLALAFPTAAPAQSPAGDTAIDAAGTTWTSIPDTDARTGTRQCSVFPLRDREGPFPMFFFYGPDVQMSVAGTDTPLMDLKLQVDANAEVDGGFLAPSPENVVALIGQIRADGRVLRLSRTVMADGRLQTASEEIPLAGAVEQFDRCRAWVGK